MNLYLSSFRIGNQPHALQSLYAGARVGVISNAIDNYVDPEARERWVIECLGELRDLDIDVEPLDLRDYFGAKGDLQARLSALGGVWVTGGNTFVLRQAMRLSGFDEALAGVTGTDFAYGGYSAGVCVLAPSLDGLQLVDEPMAGPYPGAEVIWEGLGLLDYLVLPHYKSVHPESEGIDREVDYCTRKGIPFKTLRDGDVIILKNVVPPHSA